MTLRPSHLSAAAKSSRTARCAGQKINPELVREAKRLRRRSRRGINARCAMFLLSLPSLASSISAAFSASSVQSMLAHSGAPGLSAKFISQLPQAVVQLRMRTERTTADHSKFMRQTMQKRCWEWRVRSDRLRLIAKQNGNSQCPTTT